MSLEEIFHQSVTYFSLTASLISTLLFFHFFLKIRTLNPFIIYAAGTAKAVMSRKLRNIVLLTFSSSFVFFTAYAAKYFAKNRAIYWSLEAVSLSLFFVATILLVLVEFGRRKANAQ